MILVRVCHLSNGKDLPHRVIGGLRDDPYEVFFNHLFFLVFKISFGSTGSLLLLEGFLQLWGAGATF